MKQKLSFISRIFIPEFSKQSLSCEPPSLFSDSLFYVMKFLDSSLLCLMGDEMQTSSINIEHSKAYHTNEDHREGAVLRQETVQLESCS